MVQSQITWLSGISGTPLHRFAFTRAAVSAESQKEQNEVLFAKVRKRQALLGISWRNALTTARKVANAFGSNSLDESIQPTVLWEPAQARNTNDERSEWSVKASLGVPLPTIWAEMGYTQAQIRQFQQQQQQTITEQKQL